MAEIRPFVLLQDWMFDLGLNPSEVIAVAVIYGFTQDGQHTCHVSLPYFKDGVVSISATSSNCFRGLKSMGF